MLLCSMDYRATLFERFEDAKSRRTKLSLRAYARYLGLSGSTLSSVLRGTRGLPISAGLEISRRLKLSADESEIFIKSITEEKKFNQALRSSRSVKQTEFVKLEKSQEHIAKNPHGFAIVAYLASDCADKTLDGICSELDLSKDVAAQLLKDLYLYGIVTYSGNEFQVLKSKIKTTDNVPSDAIRKAHKNTLDLAKDKLESVPLNSRYFTSMTLCCSENKLDAAKEEIKRFLGRMTNILQKSDKKEKVYEVAVQLFPHSAMKGIK